MESVGLMQQHAKRSVIRRFKWLEFGHVAEECPKDFLEKLCYRSGEPGHLDAGYGKPYKCLACEATGKSHSHRTGDITCAALRIARISAKREMSNFPSVNMLQINLNRSRKAQDLAIQTSREREVGILDILTQNRDLHDAMWFKDARGNAAIYVCKGEHYRARKV